MAIIANDQNTRKDLAGQIPTTDQQIIDAITRPGLTIAQIINIVLTSYGDRPALGWRQKSDGELAPNFTYLSYRELSQQVRSLSSAFAHDPDFKFKPQDMVATLGFAGPDYVALLLAAQYSGLPYVPLPSNATAEQLRDIVLEVQPKCLATSTQHLEQAVLCACSCDEVRIVLVFDLNEDSSNEVLALEATRNELAKSKPQATLVTFADVCNRGMGFPFVEPYITVDPNAELNSIVYTSGSTGSPKGAMYREHNAIVPWASAPYGPPQIVLHYQPLSHSYGSSYTFMTLARGGLLCFTALSDLSSFLDDLRLVRPTDLGLVPRICELLYQRACAERAPSENHNFDALRESLLGGRLRTAIIASAPLSPELRDFMENLIGFPLTDAYGSTEAGSISINGVIQNPPIVAHKLIDVPELGYFTTDKPHPRGELAVKTNRLIEGYYKRPELNANLVDEDGFYHTGDIMEEVAPGEMRFLERRNNVLKLAQGEFVAVSNLEALYAGGGGIRQVFLYGNSSRSYLLGVVVPNKDVVGAGADEGETKQHLMSAIREIAAVNNLNSYEIPHDIIVETEPFSIENGLLAGVGKYMRPAFNAKYQEQLEAMYADMAQAQASALRSLKESSDTASVEATVLKAAEISLGIDKIPNGGDVSFDEIGGDSLSAVSFALLLEDVFNFPIEVADILHPTNTLLDLARKIEYSRRPNDIARTTHDDVHGKDTTRLRSADLTLDRFISCKTLDAATKLPPASTEDPKTVLLTGANGFLGRFVALEWLERLSQNKGRLICLGRGADDAGVEARLREAFVSGDKVLEERFDKLAKHYLTCIEGDLSAPQLGLSSERWEALAERVDVITHVGALVNHRMPYRQLFQPNVGGTAELIALALTTRKKRFVNLSTIAAIFGETGATFREEADIRTAMSEFQLQDGYASGYAASKWASEVLLREANESFDLPVNVFRPNMILAHRHYRSQLNVSDIFTRLILSLALTGIAPKSFYKGEIARAHYEGLPVDFIAEAVVAISEYRRAGYQTYHVLNPHDDGISMDTFVRWIEQTGVPVERIDGYQDWRARFEAALRALPEETKMMTSLPTLEIFDEPTEAISGASMPSDQFKSAVEEALAEAGGIPHLDEELIKKYLAYLKTLGLLNQ